MDLTLVRVIAAKELRDGLRTRWFLLYTAAFTVLAGALSLLATSYSGFSGMQGFGRTAAGLLNLVLLVVPLMGLTAGAQAIAGERERGTLGYLLAQPVTRAEVFLGKLAGLALALFLAVLVSFGLTGLLLAARGVPLHAGGYLLFALLTELLALVSLSLGCLISALVSRTQAALGNVIFLWLALVFLGDLGLMGSAAVLQVGIRPIFYLSLFNPLQVFRVAAIALLQPSLDVLGPVGHFATDTLGSGLLPAFTGLLAAWGLLPLALAYSAFARRDAL